MRYLFILLFSLSNFLSFGQNLNYEPNELLVQFEPGTNTDEFIRKFEAREQLGIIGLEQVSEIVNIYLIKFHEPKLDLDQVIGALYGYYDVKIVQKKSFRK